VLFDVARDAPPGEEFGSEGVDREELADERNNILLAAKHRRR
jgi:hypothetical protein